MSFSPTPTRDPWAVAKELRALGREFYALKRQAADLQHQSEEIDAKAERLRPDFEQRQRELTACIIAPATHEVAEPFPNLGRVGYRTLAQLQASAYTLSHNPGYGQPQWMGVTLSELHTINCGRVIGEVLGEGDQWEGVRLSVSHAKIDASEAAGSKLNTAFHD